MPEQLSGNEASTGAVACRRPRVCGPARVLLLCYGNPGRLDDGLGPAIGDVLEREGLPGVTVDIDYQLTVEDAALAAEHDTVVFVDAAVRGREPFFFHSIEPVLGLGFSSHGVEPEAVLALAGELTGRVPEGYALGIRGYQFNEFGETLSSGALDNLAAALQFLLPVLKNRTFREAAAALEGSSSGDQVPCDGERKCETESM